MNYFATIIAKYTKITNITLCCQRLYECKRESDECHRVDQVGVVVVRRKRRNEKCKLRKVIDKF